jgi:hypothetical protein
MKTLVTPTQERLGKKVPKVLPTGEPQSQPEHG